MIPTHNTERRHVDNLFVADVLLYSSVDLGKINMVARGWRIPLVEVYKTNDKISMVIVQARFEVESLVVAN
jgi:hypothetical protein